MCLFSPIELHRQKVKEYKQQLAKNKTTEKEENKFPIKDSVKKSNLSHNSNNEKKLPMNDLLARRYYGFFLLYFDGYIFYQFKIHVGILWKYSIVMVFVVIVMIALQMIVMKMKT